MVGFVFSVFNGATKSPVSNSHVINYSLIWMNQNFHYVCLKNFIIFTFFRGRNCSSRGKIYLCSISLYDIYLYYIKKYKDIRKNRRVDYINCNSDIVVMFQYGTNHVFV